MAGTLKKITARAKQIYKKGGTWLSAIKKAGAEYRGGKVRGVKKRHHHHSRRRMGGTLSGNGSSAITGVRKRRSLVRRVKKFHAAEGRALAKLGSVSHHVGNAKRILEHRIGMEETKKFKTAKKASKRKIGKRIAALKSQYRKLC